MQRFPPPFFDPHPAVTTPSFMLPAWADDRFDVPCNEALLNRLLDDMARHAGPMMAADCWQLPDERNRQGLAPLLPDWCGSLGHMPLGQLRAGAALPSKALPREVLDRGMAFVHDLDHEGLFRAANLESLGDANWRVFDLASAVDYLLITAFGGWADGSNVLEVGGGFGRLPDFFARAGRRFRYVNIDAVPASLMYCHEYLQRQCPDRRVLLYLGDADSRARLADGAELVIVPAWHAAELLQDRSFELCVNVESFQEMDQALVDSYLALFDAQAADNALVYLMNARNYLFKGQFNYPARWECLLRHHTLRSWSGDQPLEVFRVGRSSAAAISRVRECFYQRERAAALADPRRQTGRHG
jgi:SAM-dependent methyltransferase